MIDGNALKIEIKGHPSIIKPNLRERCRLVDAKLKGMSHILDAARRIRDRGVTIILDAMGAQGILLVEEKCCYLAPPPPLEVVNTIGTGDSTVAGFVCGLVRKETLKQAMVYAVASGTATTLWPGLALCEKRRFSCIGPPQ